jgi:hypothetical protein
MGKHVSVDFPRRLIQLFSNDAKRMTFLRQLIIKVWVAAHLKRLPEGFSHDQQIGPHQHCRK